MFFMQKVSGRKLTSLARLNGNAVPMLSQIKLNTTRKSEHMPKKVKTTTKTPKAEVRNIAVYKPDFDFFLALAEQSDRSRAGMFRYAMSQIRQGNPIPYTNGEAK